MDVEGFSDKLPLTKESNNVGGGNIETDRLKPDAAEAIVKSVLKLQENFVTSDELARKMAEISRAQTIWLSSVIFVAMGLMGALFLHNK